jgi:hypothetical protein
MKKWIKHTIILHSIAMFSFGLAGASYISAGSCSQKSCCSAHSFQMSQNEKRLTNTQKTCCCETAFQPCNIQQTKFPLSSLRTGAHTHITQNPPSAVFQPLSAPTTQSSLNLHTLGGNEGFRQTQATPLYLANLSFLI